MLRRLFVYLFMAWAGLLSLAAAAVVEPVFPPGLRIGLEPSGDLKLSTRFPGFEDSERKVVVVILDLPASAYQELENAAFSNRQRDLQQPKRESFPFEGGIGFLISGVSQQDGITLYRWSLLARAIGENLQNLTMLINVEVPESARSIYSDEVIRKMLASVTFRPAPIQEQLSLLPFKLGNLAGFHVIQVLPTGNVILADETTDAAGPQPFVIVSVERGGPAEAGDRGIFARDLLATAPVRDLTLQSAESMRIGGAPGHEIRAQGKGPAGDVVSLVQWLRFGSGGFLRVIGVSPTDKWDQAFGRFRALRDGIVMR
ncbi:MAG TPA: hypothetical protein VKG24_16625 [Pseudolabrys sp.]|jgi:hypothetical protein|nr:hypothetical protein [Pseudolabrys sp.]